MLRRICIIYPAHAGINLRRIWPVSWNRDLPRTRGDKPRNGGVYARIIESTPHTRG